MTKFAKFDRANLKALRDEMNALLNKYGIDANLEFSVGNMKFSEVDAEIKVKATIKGAKTFSNVILETRAASLGLNLMNKMGDKLVDYNSRAYKMPFVYINAADGKRYKCDERTAKIRFGV
jgi:flagellar hook-basal body complex protein FliE